MLTSSLTPALLAAVALPFLGELVALFAASVGVAYVCYRLRIVPIVGFLLAGVLVGPGALGLVEDLAFVQQAAEVGVILLLFIIGMEFSLAKLARLRRAIIIGGGLQVGGTVALVAAGLALIGVAPGVALFTGCLVALSSTAIVLTLLADRAEGDTPAGKLTLAVLIFQDLAVVGMVLLVPAMAGEEAGAGGILFALAEAALVVGVVLVASRRVVPWVLNRLVHTRRRELFLLAVVAVGLGTAWATGLVGISLALGAFLAGLVVSESEYVEQALADIIPLQTVFNAVFFVSIGMLLDLSFLLAHLVPVAGIALGVLVLKALITTFSLRVLGFPLRTATTAGLGLAQIGEFSFVLALAGTALGLAPAGLGEAGQQGFIAVAVVLMLLTPFLMVAAPHVGEWLGRKLPSTMPDPDEPEEAVTEALEDHTVIVGYGPAGRRLARVLRETGIPFIVSELNPESVEEARRAGIPIVYGDASQGHLLDHMAVRRAKLLVVAINDRDATVRIVGRARFENPTLQIFARTRFLADIERLESAGADIVVPEELETTVRLFSHVLGAYFVPREEIERQVAQVRAGDYAVLRGSIQEAHLMVLQGLDEEGLHTRAVAVRPGAQAVGRTLAELAVRQHYGLTVLAVRRGEDTLANPTGDFRVEPGDRLILIGLADSFAEAAPLFRPSEQVGTA